MDTHYAILESDVGKLLLLASDRALREVRFLDKSFVPESSWIQGGDVLDLAQDQLQAYFQGERTDFDLPLEPLGTQFQQEVWSALRSIPFGRTTSYGEVARRLGKPKATRAVGAANGRNPLPIVIPCHRVIGADGSLTGFGGGIGRKRELLELEQRHFGRHGVQMPLL